MGNKQGSCLGAKLSARAKEEEFPNEHHDVGCNGVDDSRVCVHVCVCVCVGCLNIFGELAYFWSITDVNGDYTNPKEEIKM